MATDSNITYRQVHQSDLDALGNLFDLYRVFYRQASNPAEAIAFIEARLAHRDSRIFVADRAGELLGFTQLYPSFSSVSMKRLWILNDLYVNESARKRGVGFGLLTAARDFARADNAKGLILATENINTTAQALYASFGFVKDTTFFHYYYYF